MENSFLLSLKGWFEFFGPAGPWILAVLIIVLGYAAARILTGGLLRVLDRISLDDRIADLLGQDTDGCEKSISTFVLWLLMLFVVVFALSVAGQGEAVEPLKDVFDQILGFLPRLLAAVSIGFIAWIVATVVKNLLVGLLSASRIDERVGLGDSRPITNSIGLIAFFGIILMMLPNALAALEMREISEPIAGMVARIFDYVPKLFAGIILFAIGYLVATAVRKVLTGVLASIGTDSLPERLGYKGKQIGGRPLSDVIGIVAMATILVIIGTQAITIMDLGFISELAQGFVPGYFNFLAALIILAAAIYIANIVGQMIEGKSEFWARVARISIIVFLVAVALQKANISELTNVTFQLFITCAIVAAAFAAGVGGAIAIGLGGKEKASQWLDKIK